MSGADGFVARWARRKAEATQARAAPAVTEPPTPADPELIGEIDPADLPRLEDLTAQSDLSAFLQPGVPQALRTAALRRMWVLDPAIRDFVSEACDYAYDWNSPGGAPGYGALTLPDAARNALMRAMGGIKEGDGPALDTLSSPNGPTDEPPSSINTDSQNEDDVSHVVEQTPAPPVMETDLPDPDYIATQHDKLIDDQSIPVRRHGRALPT